MPSVGAGELREVLTIQQNTRLADGQGGFTSSWGTFATVRGMVVSLTGRELLQAAAIGSEVSYRVTIRSRSDVTAKLRIRWTPSWSSATPAKTLEVLAVRPAPADPRMYLELDCSERV